MDVAHSIEIDRPLGEVFAAFADLERAPEWAAPVVERRKLTDGPVGVGTRYRAVDRFPGRTFEFTVEITRYEPEQVIAAHWSGPMRGGWETTFEGSDGSTTLHMDAELEPTGRAARLLFPLVSGWARRAIRRDLESFKHLVESAPA